jgi:hypothetical protein
MLDDDASGAWQWLEEFGAGPRWRIMLGCLRRFRRSGISSLRHEASDRTSIRGELVAATRPLLQNYDMMPFMMKVLEDAIEKVRKLPEDRQAYVAEVLEQIAAAAGDPFSVPERHRAAVLEGLEQAERGEFVNDDEMAALWKKCGL